SNFDPSTLDPASRAPRAGKYWDGLASTNFYKEATSVSAPPNPQIGVGPDDVVTIVNRTIARYPNPNAIGNALVTNPYNNPSTSQAFLDTWLGIANLQAVCPTVPRSNSTCILDNASIRYDQMQGRFVVLFTATDVPSHIANFILVTSRYATFACPPGVAAANCPNTSDMFTNPIVPVVGGPNTGGVNQYWVMYIIPVNVIRLPNANTLSNAGKFCMVPIVGGDPTTPPAPTGGGFSAGPVVVGQCTNYFPTGARFGLDNDNIILTAPVLDVSQETGPTALRPGCTNTTAAGCAPVLPGGPYAGTRVVTVPKVGVYDGGALGGDPTNIGGTGTGLRTLSDDNATVTLSTTPTLTCCSTVTAPVPPIFWEPDNLRGRALASFDAQVAPINATGTAGSIGGVITPI